MNPPVEEPESCSYDQTRSEFSGRVGDGALRGARSGWAFVGSCRNPTSRTGAWRRRRSQGLAHGSVAGGLGSKVKVPLGASKGGSDLVGLQGDGAAERPWRSEGSLGTGHQEGGPALQAAGWSSLLPHFL